ncbi:MAG: hypothetical protein JW915_05750 [Chitinispirillaceae bacterium]|nr:hypothetical protein [Chitinispirillaceae bacterium]
MNRSNLRNSCFLILFFTIVAAAQTYACSMLSLSVEKNGVIKGKSYAVSSLYINLSTDSVKVFGNYQGMYISNGFRVDRRNHDTLFVSGNFFGKDAHVYLIVKHNLIISNYNFISNTGESTLSAQLTLKPIQNHFSEKYHERRERQQSPSAPRDLLGRQQKK